MKICKLGQVDFISQLADIGFRIQHTKLPLIKVSNPFLHKMPVLVNFSDFFPDYLSATVTRVSNVVEENVCVCFFTSPRLPVPVDSVTHFAQHNRLNMSIAIRQCAQHVKNIE